MDWNINIKDPIIGELVELELAVKEGYKYSRHKSFYIDDVEEDTILDELSDKEIETTYLSVIYVLSDESSQGETKSYELADLKSQNPLGEENGYVIIYEEQSKDIKVLDAATGKIGEPTKGEVSNEIGGSSSRFAR